MLVIIPRLICHLRINAPTSIAMTLQRTSESALATSGLSLTQIQILSPLWETGMAGLPEWRMMTLRLLNDQTATLNKILTSTLDYCCIEMPIYWASSISLHQYFNGWLQNINPYGHGSNDRLGYYFNLDVCDQGSSGRRSKSASWRVGELEAVIVLVVALLLPWARDKSEPHSIIGLLYIYYFTLYIFYASGSIIADLTPES